MMVVYAALVRSSAFAVWNRHAFQKKAKRGIATPKLEIDRLRARLRQAEEHYRREYAKTRSKGGLEHE
jgi:phage-related protein